MNEHIFMPEKGVPAEQVNRTERIRGECEREKIAMNTQLINIQRHHFPEQLKNVVINFKVIPWNKFNKMQKKEKCIISN